VFGGGLFFTINLPKQLVVFSESTGDNLGLVLCSSLLEQTVLVNQFFCKTGCIALCER
jgi:hypothetical protein